MINVIRLNSVRRTPNQEVRRKSGEIISLQQQQEIMVPELPNEVLPAQYSAQTILIELFGVFERKLNQFCNEDPLEKVFTKSLRRGEDPYLDNLLKTLHGVCEICLPSVLSAFYKWHETQQQVPINENGEAQEKAMKRTLGASYLYCIVLIEILPQVHFYPTECEQLINQILVKSFKQVSFRDPQRFGANYNNSLCVAESFAEVIGVVSQSHFKLVHKMFTEQLDQLRKETPLTPLVIGKIISLLMGMKFFRIKTNDIGDFEMGVNFLNQLGSYYLEVDLKQKDLKHALAGLLVEILAPAAGEIKTEANVPSLVKFVESLYGATYELVNKKAHRMAAYPLITCLLCVSTAKFFLNNWVQFLNLTLANLKNKDSKMARIALESLYRLLWVYTIRINCEGNTNTRNRLESICSSLFPKGNRNVIPKDSPINIFVKVIHFIAFQNIGYAFEEIIFDLLGCNRGSRTIPIYPERMNIGIRALIVIIDGLQQSPGERQKIDFPSGTIQRAKRTYITRPLTHDIAAAIGLDKYLHRCRKAFDSILRTLDTQVGRSFLLTVSQTKGKEPEDLLIGDNKPKLDLLRTCIAAIPRLLPDPMSHQELIELLTRITIHIDEELRVTACQTLQNLITECAEWREEIINTYLNFLTKDIQDTFPTLLESTIRFLLQLLCAWKSVVQTEKKNAQNVEQKTPFWMMSKSKVQQTPSEATTASVADSLHSHDDQQTVGSVGSELSSPYNRANALIVNQTAQAIHNVEGFAFMLLCQLRSQTKRIAISLLKECRQLLTLTEIEVYDQPLISVLDEATPYVFKKFIEHVPNSEKQSWNTDFAFACEKISNIEPDAFLLVNGDRGNEYMRWDPFACALSGYCEYQFLPLKCPTAVAFAWSAIFRRLNHCSQYVDPTNPQNESRASLLRSSKSKATAPLCGEALSQDSYLNLWQKYLTVCCALVPPPNGASNRSFSPGLSESDAVRSMTSSIRINRPSIMDSAPLFVKVSNMLRWEHMTDLRDSVALGVGSTNPACFEYLLDELSNRNILRETQEKKLENNARRRKRKDLLRLQVLRVIEIGFFRGLLEYGNLIDHQTGLMSSVLLKIIESLKDHVVSDADRDISILTSLRLHFAKTIVLAINSVPLERRKFLFPPHLKRELITIFYKWCSRSIGASKQGNEKDSVGTYVEQKSVEALCALLCCGSIFENPSEQDYYLKMLDDLLSSSNDSLCNIFVETLSMILNLNDQCTNLFEWTISACYTRPNAIAVKAFKALALLFSKREFPCDYIGLLVLCQVYALDTNASVRESAVMFIQILRRQFLDNALPSCQNGINESGNGSFLSSSITNESPNKRKRQTFPTNFDSISKDLSSSYTQLTMPIISELFCRFDNAKTNRQSAMLSILLHWIGHVELVDPFSDMISSSEALETSSVKGWGSSEATQLLLNNLVYVTAKSLSEHSKGISALWKCLAKSYPSNLSVILHILFVMVSLSPEFFIQVAKQIAEYLLDSSGNQFVLMLMEQLVNSGEQFKLTLVRSEIPPYYFWRPIQSENSETPQSTDQLADKERPKTQKSLEDHSADTVEKDETNGVSVPCDPKNERQKIDSKMRAKQPQTLPMPAYGGFYSNLSTFLPPSTQPVAYFSRSNLALFLLSDLIGADNGGVDWKSHVQVLLNVSVISLDSSRPLVCRHARLTILYLCLHFAPQDINVGQIANQLLAQKCELTDQNESRFLNSICSKYVQQNAESSFELNDSNATSLQTKRAEFRRQLFFSNNMFPNNTELLMALCYCLTDTIDRPIWMNEEVSVKNWKIESADQLGCFVRHLAEYFIGTLHNLACKWTEFAMKIALTTSNRHIAGRCFQISAALCQNLSPYINQMLSRLVEFVGESNEDAQSYIIHLFLCLHASVPQIIKKGSQAAMEKVLESSPISSSHTRSISYTPALLQTLNLSNPANSTSPPNVQSAKKDARFSLLLENEQKAESSQTMNRCKSATLLDGSIMITEEALSALSQLIALCSCLLESDIDNEHLLALHLLNHVFECSASDRVECTKRFDSTVQQLAWSFNGLVPLVSRGVSFSSGCENAISILKYSIDLLEYPAVGSPDLFSLIVVAVLPYCLVHFDSPTAIGAEAARNIANHCVKRLPDEPDQNFPTDHPLHNLATMMNQYQEKSFSRDKLQWAKCVISYLLDGFSPNILDLVVFTCEVLERSHSNMHAYLLHIVYLLILHGDLSNAFPSLMNTQVVRIVMRHIQSVNWKEAARIMKTILDKWNRISVNQMPESEGIAGHRKPTFDLYIDKFETYSPQSPRKLVSTQQSMSGNADSLRRQQANSVQAHVRERLVSLLAASGLPIGLPRSSSVIFSQSSSDVHYDGGLVSNSNIQIAASNSAFSSSEVVSQDELESASSLNVGNESADSFPRVFKEFDFLEAERDTISETESCFNWLSTMRPMCSTNDENTADLEEVGDDEFNDQDELNQQFESELTDEIDFNARSSLSSFMGQRRNRRFSGRFSRPMSRTSDSNDFSSDRTPIQSEKHSDDSLASCSSDDEDSTDLRASSSNAKKYYKPSLTNLTSPIESGSTASYQVNEDSALNILETNSSIPCHSESSQTQQNQAERVYVLKIECTHHCTNKFEQTWLNRVHDIESDRDGQAASQCIMGFSQVFRECCLKLSTLLRDASHLLTSSNEQMFRMDMSSYFTHALNVVLKLAECPFLFVTASYLLSTNLLQAEKYNLYQMRQHLETFLERREQSIRALNSIKSSLKLQTLSSQSSGLNIVSQEIELCRYFLQESFLYTGLRQQLEKLFFQLLQMLELFNNIVNSVQNTPNSQEFAISPAVNRLHHDLLSCVNELPLQPDSRLSTTSLNIPGNEQLSDILTLHLTNRQYKNALITLHQLRSQFGSEFGCCDDTNVDALLIHYCQSHKLKTWTLIGSVDILQTGCAQLREKTCMFGSMIRTLMADSEGTVRSSRVSSVNESMYNSATHTS